MSALGLEKKENSVLSEEGLRCCVAQMWWENAGVSSRSRGVEHAQC